MDMAANVPYHPLHEQYSLKNTKSRVVELIILFLLLSLLFYRLFHFTDYGWTWVLAFCCESWFTFIWALSMNTKWNQICLKTYPERLLQWKADHELPPVDMFVTTADPILEPPIITVNTVLSLLAVDYPANKLACYVSDDGCSPLTFFSLIEASKFAKLWVPFCKKYNVLVRAPFRYFNGNPSSFNEASLEFQEDWKRAKDEYEELCKKIEDAAQRFVPFDVTREFADFSNIERSNHPTIIKVIWENKEALPNGLPHLVYVSREKRPNHSHHFKAGAMNVLLRVSGVMTNAPFMLNVDCDMYVNNPQIVLHAMCLLLGVNNERGDYAFVQTPQKFYDGLKDDPFGNQLLIIHAYHVRGIAGLQGPFYEGTGCFHRRKVLYGLSPDVSLSNGELGDENLKRSFGKSMKLCKSAVEIISGSDVKTIQNTDSPSSCIETAYQVACCGYEYGTRWGEKIGLIYGSATEDILTGIIIHGKGWRTVYLEPNPPGFLGSAPSSGPTSLNQQKRWSTGLLEIVFSSKNPILATFTGKLQFRQCLAYLWLLFWGLRSVPELCYAVLPAYCLITNSNFLPKVHESAIIVPLSLFIIYMIYTLSEYQGTGLSIRTWWNNQRMERIIAMTSWLLGFLSAILKLFGLSETSFQVTNKDQTTSSDDTNSDAGRFMFDESPIFVPATTVLLVNLTAMVIGLFEFQAINGGGNGSGIGEIICSVLVVLCFWPFFKGLFGRGKYGIPSSVICKSGALALLFVQFCK